MYRYNRVLIVLDWNDEDKSLIEYTAMISKMAHSKKLYFLQIAEDLDIPNTIRTEYPEILKPVDEFATGKLQDFVRTHFDGFPDSELFFEVVTGNPQEEVIKRISQRDIDLVIVPKSSDQKGSNKLSYKLARKAPCSVLTIPVGFPAKITKMTVGLDFSDHSQNVIDVATAFGKAANLTELDIVHSYSVPIGYYKTGKSYEEFAAIMENNSKKDYQEFLRNANMKGLVPNSMYILNDDAAEALDKYSETVDADLVVLGARGRTMGAAILLGSVTEKLLSISDVPVLAVKEKNAGMGLLDVLFKTKDN